MIELKDVSKSFDGSCAVNHVSFSIPEGVMFGLLGTNGRSFFSPRDRG